MATHSSVLVWRIPRMGEPVGLPSMGSHRVGHDWHEQQGHRYRLGPFRRGIYFNLLNWRFLRKNLMWSKQLFESIELATSLQTGESERPSCLCGEDWRMVALKMGHRATPQGYPESRKCWSWAAEEISWGVILKTLVSLRWATLRSRPTVEVWRGWHFPIWHKKHKIKFLPKGTDFPQRRIRLSLTPIDIPQKSAKQTKNTQPDAGQSILSSLCLQKFWTAPLVDDFMSMQQSPSSLCALRLPQLLPGLPLTWLHPPAPNHCLSLPPLLGPSDHLCALLYSPWTYPLSHRQTSRVVLFRVKQHYVTVFFQTSEDTALASLPLAQTPNKCHTPAWPFAVPSAWDALPCFMVLSECHLLRAASWRCPVTLLSIDPLHGSLYWWWRVCAVHLHQQDVNPLRVAFCFAHLSWFRAWIRARFSNICQMNECGDLSRKYFPLDLLLLLGSHFLWSLKVLT